MNSTVPPKINGAVVTLFYAMYCLKKLFRIHKLFRLKSLKVAMIYWTAFWHQYNLYVLCMRTTYLRPYKTDPRNLILTPIEIVIFDYTMYVDLVRYIDV